MKITVLDYDNLLVSRESWRILESLGELTLLTSEEDASAALAETEAVLTVSRRLSGQDIRQAKNLRYIGVIGADCSCVDMSAAGEAGVPVAAIPDAYAMVQVQYAVRSAMQGCADPFRPVSSLTVGAIGCGLAGRTFLEIMAKMGAETLAHDHAFNMSYHRGVMHYVLQRERFLPRCDLIAVFRPSLPLPDAPLTMRGVYGLTNLHSYLDADAISGMKDGAILIDVYPGVVDRQAAGAAVHRGKLACFLDTMVPRDAYTDAQLIRTACESLRSHINGIGTYVW